ncbi:putative phosphatase regulatory subunit-domain-containing protein [Russula earlei]|uniref:Phosphatase regulatory subunit-domain-containing protein n=1 Tax=Russula earlei TaxID=71964 RepID=A0ACC0TRL7_9AGAM|nr:putative phosphatase regulatory subunit-domain-containing protein [Russula earlei]
MPYAETGAGHRLNPVKNWLSLSSSLPHPCSSSRKVQSASTISQTSAQAKPRKSILKFSTSGPAPAPTPASSHVLDENSFQSSRKSVRFGHDKDRDGELSDDDDDDDDDLVSQPPQRLSQPPVLFEVADISQIPSPYTPTHAEIQLVELTSVLVPTQLTAQLRGVVRVRNLAYVKHVAARFTTDDWATVSEVTAQYFDPPLPGDGMWDSFAFSTTLQLHAPPGARCRRRTFLLAVFLSVPGVGEWWDNNGGNNFRIVLATVGAGGEQPPGLGPTSHERRAIDELG